MSYCLLDSDGTNVWGEAPNYAEPWIAIRQAVATWETGWFDRLELHHDRDVIWTSAGLERPAGAPRDVAARRIAKRHIGDVSHLVGIFGRDEAVKWIIRSHGGSHGWSADVQTDGPHVHVRKIGGVPVSFRFTVASLVDEALRDAAGDSAQQLSLFEVAA